MLPSVEKLNADNVILCCVTYYLSYLTEMSQRVVHNCQMDSITWHWAQYSISTCIKVKVNACIIKKILSKVKQIKSIYLFCILWNQSQIYVQGIILLKEIQVYFQDIFSFKEYTI
jgi:hypothetical protein